MYNARPVNSAIDPIGDYMNQVENAPLSSRTRLFAASEELQTVTVVNHKKPKEAMEQMRIQRSRKRDKLYNNAGKGFDYSTYLKDREYESASMGQEFMPLSAFSETEANMFARTGGESEVSVIRAPPPGDVFQSMEIYRKLIPEMEQLRASVLAAALDQARTRKRLGEVGKKEEGSQADLTPLERDARRREFEVQRGQAVRDEIDNVLATYLDVGPPPRPMVGVPSNARGFEMAAADSVEGDLFNVPVPAPPAPRAPQTEEERIADSIGRAAVSDLADLGDLEEYVPGAVRTDEREAGEAMMETGEEGKEDESAEEEARRITEQRHREEQGKQLRKQAILLRLLEYTDKNPDVSDREVVSAMKKTAIGYGIAAAREIEDDSTIEDAIAIVVTGDPEIDPDNFADDVIKAIGSERASTVPGGAASEAGGTETTGAAGGGGAAGEEVAEEKRSREVAGEISEAGIKDLVKELTSHAISKDIFKEAFDNTYVPLFKAALAKIGYTDGMDAETLYSKLTDNTKYGYEKYNTRVYEALCNYFGIEPYGKGLTWTSAIAGRKEGYLYNDLYKTGGARADPINKKAVEAVGAKQYLAFRLSRVTEYTIDELHQRKMI